MATAAEVIKEEGHAGFFRRPSCGACLNFSREKDSATLSLVDGEVEIYVRMKIILHTLGMVVTAPRFDFTSQRQMASRLPTEPWGDRYTFKGYTCMYTCVKFSGAYGYRRWNIFIFPVQLTTTRIVNLTRLIKTLLYGMVIHSHIYGLDTYLIDLSYE